jgi:hypothetical protein
MLAHATGADALPAPVWLLSYLGIALVLATAVVLRATWPSARATAQSPDPAIALDLHVGHVIGTLLYAGAVGLCFSGPDSSAASFVYWFVLVVFWVGLPIACLVLGDVVRAVHPFVVPVALLGRVSGRERGPGPTWSASAFLAAWSWYLLAYHEPGPRSLGLLLIAYAGFAVAGGLWWGRGWLRTGEAFGALSAAVGRTGLRGRARLAPVAGAALLMLVWVGSTAFDGFTSRPFWLDVLGTSRGWTRTLINTAGLVWITAIAGGAFLLVSRVAERGQRDADQGRRLTEPLGWALVPLAAGWFVGHDLTFLLVEGQNAIALASDPLGRGWDLFGTITYTIDYSIVTDSWVPWVQLACIAVGHIASVVLLHELALERLPARAAMRTTWAMAVVAAASITAAAVLVLA